LRSNSSQQINTDKKSQKRWLLFQEYVYDNGIKINFEHIKGVKNVVVDIFSRFAGIQQDEALQSLLPKYKTQNEVRQSRITSTYK